MTRVQWADIAGAARETSEALVGKDWVDASTKARVLLADLADEVDRLRDEVAREREQRDLRHQAYLECCQKIEAMKTQSDAIANTLADDRDQVARERDALINAAIWDGVAGWAWQIGVLAPRVFLPSREQAMGEVRKAAGLDG